MDGWENAFHSLVPLLLYPNVVELHIMHPGRWAVHDTDGEAWVKFYPDKAKMDMNSKSLFTLNATHKTSKRTT